MTQTGKGLIGEIASVQFVQLWTLTELDVFQALEGFNKLGDYTIERAQLALAIVFQCGVSCLTLRFNLVVGSIHHGACIVIQIFGVAMVDRTADAFGRTVNTSSRCDSTNDQRNRHGRFLTRE
ncbi:hypothetical protein D9M71_758470 [compost metagenome]